ncbi:MAG: hypothetical protein IPN77_32975 [Sandaracinaceae bacterium]|nr:hypothetical protein [Sandaracinaceae bacterium]
MTDMAARSASVASTGMPMASAVASTSGELPRPMRSSHSGSMASTLVGCARCSPGAKSPSTYTSPAALT